MMIPLDTFIPLITPFAKGVGIPSVNAAIRQAAIDFCVRTKLWRWRDEFTITQSDCEELACPSGSVIYLIENVLFNGCELDGRTLEWMNENRHQWESREDEYTGQPTEYTQRNEGSIILYPRASGKVRISAWLKPTQDAQQLPKFLGDSYRREIADGALSQLLMLPAQPFSDPSMAQFYSMKFSKRLDELSFKSDTGQQRAVVRTISRFY